MSRMKLAVIVIFGLTAIISGVLIMSNQPTQVNQNKSRLETAQLLSPSQRVTPEETGKTEVRSKLSWSQPPVMEIDPQASYAATLVTEAGVIKVALDAKNTPRTVNNFVFLARQGFYDGTVFHRVIDGFMIQGGDPEGTGRGGPGYTFSDEPIKGEYRRGVLAMANSGPNTNGSQFFIMQADRPLPPNYVIFGRVTGGMEVVDRIAGAPVTAGPGGEQSVPLEPVTVKRVTITEN